MPTDRRKPLLLNEWEVATDEALAESAARCGVRVLTKVRLSSALNLDRSGLTNEQFNYGTRAELDFLIVDGTNAIAQFAVEYDGPQHLSDPVTMRRDRLKGEICLKLGLPLVRIGSEYIRRERGFSLIGYLMEVWNLERSFTSAQNRGEIPFDEIFAPELILAEMGEGPFDFPYWLDRPARLGMAKAQRAGKLVSGIPEELVTPSPGPGGSEPEIIEAWALIELPNSRYVVGYSKLRNHPVFIPGTTPRSLASNVAVADAGTRLDRALQGDTTATCGLDELQQIRSRTKGWMPQGGLVSGH